MRHLFQAEDFLLKPCHFDLLLLLIFAGLSRLPTCVPPVLKHRFGEFSIFGRLGFAILIGRFQSLFFKLRGIFVAYNWAVDFVFGFHDFLRG
jgi:hypothetical protein